MKVDLGQVITILANLGVIAGIVFLGVELRQNNELMEAEARNARNIRVTDIATHIYTDTGMAEVLVKAGNGDELSEVEQFKLYVFNTRRLRGMDAQYREFLAGSLTSTELNIPGLRAAFRGEVYNAPMKDAWERMKPVFADEFVEWFDENVAYEH